MAQIPTTFLIISDTHGESMPNLASLPPVDVAIHCGDLTEESTLAEFDSALDLLRSIKADLKLVIAGNHDLSMDVPRFEEKIREALRVGMNDGEGMGSAGTGMATGPAPDAVAAVALQVTISMQGAALLAPATATATATATTLSLPLYPVSAPVAPPSSDISLEDIHQSFGYPGQVPSLFRRARDEGIRLLGEGIHDFALDNGAWLRVFASPATGSSSSSPSNMGAFQYPSSEREGHTFGMTRADNIDVVITHGPPEGILDRTEDRLRAGCPNLFTAVWQARPRLHCFGHIHEGWGARMVTWRDSASGSGGGDGRERASHFTAIDNDNSFLVESLATLRPGKWDSPEVVEEKSEKLEGYRRRGYCGESFSSSLVVPRRAVAGDGDGDMEFRAADMDGDGDVNLPDADALDIDHEDLRTAVRGSLNGRMETNQMDGGGDIMRGEEVNGPHAVKKGIPLKQGKQTLFVNAAIQGVDDVDGQQLPWIVTIDLPEAPYDGY